MKEIDWEQREFELEKLFLRTISSIEWGKGWPCASSETNPAEIMVEQALAMARMTVTMMREKRAGIVRHEDWWGYYYNNTYKNYESNHEKNEED